MRNEKYRINIAVIQEIKLRGSAVLDTGSFISMYNSNESNIFGSSFIINS